MMAKFCRACGTAFSPNALYCRQCGAPRVRRQIGQNTDTEPAELEKPVQPLTHAAPPTAPAPTISAVKHTTNVVGRPLGAMLASAAGDMIFDFEPPPALVQVTDSAASAMDAINPFKLLFEGVRQLLQGLGGALRDKKKLIPALVLGSIWLVLTLLPALGIAIPGGQFLSWLTFAQGGTRGGVSGFLGGVFGKGLFAALLAGVFNRTNRPQSSAPTNGERLRLLPSGDVGVLLAGIGTALFLYNLMTGDNSLQNSMIGIVAVLSLLRSLRTQAGFLRRLLASIAQPFMRGRGVSSAGLHRFLAGMASGFAVAVPLSALNLPWLGYALGSVACIVGLIVARTARTARQEGVAI